MPIAIKNIEDAKRFELKTCEGGFVLLRHMSYGQIVQRRAMNTIALASSRGDKESFVGEMALGSVAINNFEFATCVTEHNLEKAEGVLFNFKNPVDLQLLDPRIGQEIEGYISEMNSYEASEGESMPVSKPV